MENYQLSIKNYPFYKNSETAWLGDVPEHWSLSRIKSLTKTKSGTTPKSGTDEYYENGTHFWIRTTDLNNDRLFSSEFKVTDLAIENNGLTFIQPKSILLAMYGGMGTIGKNSILEVEATINQSVCAIFPNTKKFDSVYLWYYLQFFRPHWEIFADSARKDPNINQEAIKRLWVAVPPLDEQKTIAHYLDTKTAQIDRKIDLLTQKATQYGNLKQSLINETVTRGLDKSVPMKDSSIEWIGDVPKHWEVKRLEDLVNVIDPQPDHRAPAISEGEGYPYIGIRDVNYDGTLNFESARKVELSAIEKQENSFRIQDGDILFCKVGTLGEPKIIKPRERFALSATLVLIKTRVLYSNVFIRYSLDSNFTNTQINYFGSGSTRPALGIKQIRKFLLPVPPLSEQKAIADYLDTKTAQIDQIIQTINTQLEKFKELRRTLINDVVTGKIKVIEDDPISQNS